MGWSVGGMGMGMGMGRGSWMMGECVETRIQEAPVEPKKACLVWQHLLCMLGVLSVLLAARTGGRKCTHADGREVRG